MHPGFKVRDGGGMGASGLRLPRLQIQDQGLKVGWSKHALLCRFPLETAWRCLSYSEPKEVPGRGCCLPAQQDRGRKVLETRQGAPPGAGRRLRSEAADAFHAGDVTGPRWSRHQVPKRPHRTAAAGTWEARKSPNEPPERKAAVQAWGQAGAKCLKGRRGPRRGRGGRREGARERSCRQRPREEAAWLAQALREPSIHTPELRAGRDSTHPPTAPLLHTHTLTHTHTHPPPHTPHTPTPTQLPKHPTT